MLLPAGWAGVDGDAVVPSSALARQDRLARPTEFRVKSTLQAFGQIAERLGGLAQMGVFLFELADAGETLLDRSRSVIRFDHFAFLRCE